jgi:hypothetical protein
MWRCRRSGGFLALAADYITVIKNNGSPRHSYMYNAHNNKYNSVPALKGSNMNSFKFASHVYSTYISGGKLINIPATANSAFQIAYK